MHAGIIYVAYHSQRFIFFPLNFSRSFSVTYHNITLIIFIYLISLVFVQFITNHYFSLFYHFRLFFFVVCFCVMVDMHSSRLPHTPTHPTHQGSTPYALQLSASREPRQSSQIRSRSFLCVLLCQRRAFRPQTALRSQTVG